jgi:SPP1 gp7 family putative phage head morphogenesis protein
VDRAKRLGLRESEKARALRAKAFNLRSAPIERAWVKTARRLLSGIRAAVLEEIGRRAAIAEGRALGQEVAKQNVPIPGGWVIDPLFDVAAVEDEWFVSFKELADRTVQTGGQDLFDEVADVFVGFNIERPEIQQFINERLASKIVTIVENRHSEVREIVRKSIELNQTIQELRDELRSHFDRKSAGWATRIARTETATLYNFGAEEAMKEANVPAKMWISARDDDVRESHRMVDGTVVPITGDFVLAGGSGPRPGEIGVPEEDINCRCTIVPEALPEA